jgi:hypothetical protein
MRARQGGENTRGHGAARSSQSHDVEGQRREMPPDEKGAAMNEQADQICDAVAARLREVLPQMFKELYAATLQARSPEDDRTHARLRGLLSMRGDGMTIEQMNEQLAKLASLAHDIERALRNARVDAKGLSEETGEIASQAFSAERSLRTALSWTSDLDDEIERLRAR